ncbi:MAG: hypothetical protein IPQ03_15795 [Bacteroidetes bacterium]|nr:hypothetical protein [Bacteroidota bacterium]MBL0258903.1 hypothetical protein [Bacteroidota bacterium]
MIRRSRRFVFLLFVGLYLLQSQSIEAQNASSSPYSRFGIGDLQFNGFSRNTAMGGITQGLQHPFCLNLGNPASYSSLGLTTYEVGVNLSLYELETSTLKQQGHTTSLGYFAFGFPVKAKKWGLGFGLLPYSNIGYSINDTRTNILNTREVHTYKGSGGLNQFFFTNGISLAKNFSAGLTVSYLFGVLNQDRTVEFDDATFFNTHVSNSTAVGWFHFNLGLQYAFDSLRISPSDSILMIDRQISLDEDSLHKVKTLSKSNKDTLLQPDFGSKITALQSAIEASKDMRSKVIDRKKKGDWGLTMGFTIAPSASLRARNSTLVYNWKYYAGTQILIRDTVVNNSGQKGKIKLPLNLGFGFAAHKGNQWLFGADLSLQNWKEYSAFDQTDSLSDSWRVSAGAQFVPSDRALKSYLKVMQYRLGVHYAQTFLNLNQTQLNEMGVSMGIGFPIRRAGTTVQLSAEGGSRGTTDQNLIREKYVRITLGFTLNDRWFLKQKFD